MRRPLRRLHFGLWVVLSPVILGFIAYALTRTPMELIETDAPAGLFADQGSR